MVKKVLVTALATSLCMGVVGTSFAQSVGSPFTSVSTIRKIPAVVAKPSPSLTPKAPVQNWVAIGAVAAAVYAATEIAHHVKESWFPGIKPTLPVINPVMFDAPVAK